MDSGAFVEVCADGEVKVGTSLTMDTGIHKGSCVGDVSGSLTCVTLDNYNLHLQAVLKIIGACMHVQNKF